jgi:hypothetical protein
MPIKTDNIYNIDKKFDYFTIKAMVIESLQKILLAAKQEQEEQGQQQQTITFDYKALVGEEGDDDDDDDYKQDEINQDEEITSESIDISNISTATITSNNNLSDIDYNGVDNHNIKLSPSILKLKIRNTTEYLRWRIAVIKRDNFRCQICSASIKENKAVRLEVHHAKTFNDICTDNNITSIKQALECNEMWSIDNGISLCYTCHKNLEKLRSKIRNIFV